MPEPQPLQSRGWRYRPCFSKDDLWVFFFINVNERHQICRIPAQGGKISPLLNDDRGTSHGSYADPNGEYLLMRSTRHGKYGIGGAALLTDLHHASSNRQALRKLCGMRPERKTVLLPSTYQEENGEKSCVVVKKSDSITRFS